MTEIFDVTNQGFATVDVDGAALQLSIARVNGGAMFALLLEGACAGDRFGGSMRVRADKPSAIYEMVPLLFGHPGWNLQYRRANAPAVAQVDTGTLQVMQVDLKRRLERLEAQPGCGSLDDFAAQYAAVCEELERRAAQLDMFGGAP